tara:strand:+ start:283 stop:609 length:327 start_codon:yes stop_codon:yes gene_type:complete
MTKFIATFILILLFSVSFKVAAQDNSQPEALATYKTPQKANPLIEKINDLTGNDDLLTEQVVFEIRKNQTTKIKRMVTDNDFNNLSEELKKEAIKQSDVIVIIKSLKK